LDEAAVASASGDEVKVEPRLLALSIDRQGSKVRLDASGVEDEPLITRPELAAALLAVHDILDEVRRIRRLLSNGEEEEEDLGE